MNNFLRQLNALAERNGMYFNAECLRQYITFQVWILTVQVK